MTLTLTASALAGAAYSWIGPNGFSSTSQNPSIAHTATNAAGLYSVTATLAGCSSPAGTTLVTVNPPVTVSFQPASDRVTLTWPSGMLQSATNIAGPWRDLPGTNSPYTPAVTIPQQFFRVKLQ
jgi:hypothetical protein